MTDAIKQKIWDLMWPQIEAYDCSGDVLNRNFLTAKVEELIEEIEEEENTAIATAARDAWEDGWDSAKDCDTDEIISLKDLFYVTRDELQGIIEKMNMRYNQ